MKAGIIRIDYHWKVCGDFSDKSDIIENDIDFNDAVIESIESCIKYLYTFHSNLQNFLVLYDIA